MSISYEGIGEWCATFVCGAVSEGDIVKVSANGTVGKCTAGDGFCGVVRAVAHDGKACTGVSKSGENQSGSSYLVLSVDSAADKAVIKL